LIFDDGSLREMVIWLLPEKTLERGLKYRLFMGFPMGHALYDTTMKRAKVITDISEIAKNLTSSRMPINWWMISSGTLTAIGGGYDKKMHPNRCER